MCHHLSVRHTNEHCSTVDAFHEAYTSACEDLSNFLKNLWMSGHDVEEQDVAFTEAWVKRIQEAPSQTVDVTASAGAGDGDLTNSGGVDPTLAARSNDDNDAASSASTLTIPDNSIDDFQDSALSSQTASSAPEPNDASNQGETVAEAPRFPSVSAALESLCGGIDGQGVQDLIKQASHLIPFVQNVPIDNFSKEELAIKVSNYLEYSKESNGSKCKMCSARLASKAGRIVDEHVYRHFKIHLWECRVCGLRRSTQNEICQHMICLHPEAPLIINRRRTPQGQGTTPSKSTATTINSKLYGAELFSL